MWYSIAGMLSASFGASMLPIAKFAWEKLEFLLAPSQEREKQQQVYPCSENAGWYPLTVRVKA